MALEENWLTGLREEFDFIFKVLGSQVFSLPTRLGVSIPAKRERTSLLQEQAPI